MIEDFHSNVKSINVIYELLYDRLLRATFIKKKRFLSIDLYQEYSF
ncbi:hypothetical protein LEP1GSC021_4131 [Leptospira noguchii str. 1993005606]|nr:hypothetical protein LEP1GSC021_4131 [Leptospira noguchii str. 1993005606]